MCIRLSADRAQAKYAGVDICIIKSMEDDLSIALLNNTCVLLS
jgi:hypothetical protein